MTNVRRWFAVCCLALPSVIAACPALFLVTGINWSSGSDSTRTSPPAWPPGPHQLGSAVQYPASFISLDAVVIADLNGDGRNDVAAIQAGGPNILVYYQTAAGRFGMPVILNAGDVALHGVAAGDLNGDRRADLAVSGTAVNGAGGRLMIFFQTPAGDLTAPVVDTVSSDIAGGLAIGDVNADGRSDVVVMADWVVGPGAGRLSIHYQQLDGSLGPEVLYDHGSITYLGDIHIADMNHDGRNDIVLQTGTDVSVILQTAADTLSDTLDTYTVPNTLGYRVFPIGVGDVNNDGWTDVLVPDGSNSSILRVWRQTAAGTLQPADSILLGAAPNHLAIADVDGDGQPDVVAAAGGQVVVLYQSPDHRFPTVSYYGLPNVTGISGSGLAVDDVTGDGRIDVVATSGTSGVYVLPGILK